MRALRSRAPSELARTKGAGGPRAAEKVLDIYGRFRYNSYGLFLLRRISVRTEENHLVDTAEPHRNPPVLSHCCSLSCGYLSTCIPRGSNNLWERQATSLDITRPRDCDIPPDAKHRSGPTAPTPASDARFLRPETANRAPG